jgi:uncharacterized protein (DUF362 family)/ferredoxin
VEPVSITRSSGYEYTQLRQDVVRLLEPLGGMPAFVCSGDRVLLKPNMLAAKKPEQAVTTHPVLIQVIAELVAEAGGIVFIGDSPGYGNYQRVADNCGVTKAAQNSGAKLIEFTDAVELRGNGTFRSIHVSRAYYEADKIINLPKLKTHEMMTMTCAVKNLFGAVIGTEKAGWHLKVGKSRELFAQLLLEIYQLKKPALNIVDAILAMEGNGPGSGDPVKLGYLLAGANPVAVDVIAGQLTGIPADLLHIERTAARLGLPGALRQEITLYGASTEVFPAAHFRLPAGLDAQFGLPAFLVKALKDQLTSYPEADKNKCISCGVCRDACPPAAITIQNSALSVDNARCIRCWCCRELCPYDAMATKKSLLLRILKRLSKR